MPRRHPIPRLWLMTDLRMGEGLWDALERLPRGAGVVFRHYELRGGERHALFEKVRRVGRRRGLLVVAAGDMPMRGEQGAHNSRRRTGIATRAVHSRRELIVAKRDGVDAVFASPVFATRSHPGGRALGAVRLGLMIRDARVPVIALGRMDARQMRRLRGLGVYGWAGIDAWSPAWQSQAVRPRATRGWPDFPPIF